MKTCKKTTLLWNDGGKERQENFPTSGCMRSSCKAVFALSFLPLFHSIVVFQLGCFHPCLVSVLFTGPSLLKMKFYRNFFPQQIMCLVTCLVSRSSAPAWITQTMLVTHGLQQAVVFSLVDVSFQQAMQPASSLQMQPASRLHVHKLPACTTALQ